MKKKLSFFLFLLLFSIKGFSQGENNNWYFGNNAAVNFSTTPPTALTNSSMTTNEGIASVSNANGQLLFYTNGINVWNKNHLVMPTGFGLTGHSSTVQSALIVPFVNNPDRYYVFTVYANGLNHPNPYSYSVVDMTLDNSNGGIVTGLKNLPLKTETGAILAGGASSNEAITVSKNNTEDGYWILVPYNNRLYTYKIDANGLNDIPTSVVDMTFISNPSLVFAQIKVSPNKSKICVSSMTQILMRIYTFNCSTGTIDTSQPVYGCNNCTFLNTEFSNNDKVFYGTVLGGSGVNVYNLDNLSAGFRFLTSPTLQTIGLQRKDNDDNIYVTSFNSTSGSTSYLHRITNSNSFQNSQLEANYVYLGFNRTTGESLPQLVPVFNLFSTCQPNIVLSSPELNTAFTYTAGNSILTQTNYTINPGSDITMKAGNTILLKPNTLITSGAVFLAKIEACQNFSSKSQFSKNSPQYVELKFEDGGEDSNDMELNIYPNPVSDGMLFIASDNDEAKTAEVYNVLGKTVLSAKVNNKSIDVSGLSGGIYIIKITGNGKTATRRLVIE